MLTGVYTGTIPYGRLFELARVLLDAAADGDALAREAADMLADEVAAFVRAAVIRLDLQDEPVEVVLGGGVFDTSDAAFHDRVAAGIHDVAPRAVLVRLDAPPVLGAALIGLDAIGRPPSALGQLRATRSPPPRPDLRAEPPALARAGPTPAPAPTPAAACAVCGMASATSRSSSASSAWARCFTISMTSGCSSGFHPSRSSVSPLRRASVSFSSAVVPGRRQVEVAIGAPAAFLDHAGRRPARRRRAG